MHATQLACPHCQSTLTFGMAIAVGSPVECLICSQPFLAENPVAIAIEAPEPPPAPTISDVTAPDHATTELAPLVPRHDHACDVPVGKLATPVGKPAIPVGKPAIPVSKPATPASAVPEPAKPHAVPPPIPSQKSSPRRRVIEDDESEEAPLPWGMIAASVGALLLLAGGVGLGLWKLAGGGGDSTLDPVLAQSKPAEKLEVKPSTLPGGEKSDKSAEPPASEPKSVASKDDDEPGKLLKRKPRPAGSNEFELSSVPAITISRSAVPGVDQEKIDQAIAAGVKYLREQQNANTGSWSNGSHQVGHAALGGLTLLECKVVPDDPAVLRAAHFVRMQAERLNQTYELSLAILFLDRLGNPRDRGLIQGMALRLLAGQSDTGGWTYSCPLLNPQEMHQLYNFVHATKPVPLFDPLSAGDPLANPTKKKPVDMPNPLTGDPNSQDPFQQLSRLILDQGVAGEDVKRIPEEPKKGGVLEPIEAKDPPAKKTAEKKTPAKTTAKAKSPKVVNPNALLPGLRNLTIVQNQGRGKGQFRLGPAHGVGDNSNTQFAMLALWAARRHGVPTDRALLLSHQRFTNSQGPQGTWGYQPTHPNGTPAMTGVGLLGLAMGHGTSPDVIFANPAQPDMKEATVQPALLDPQIKKGLSAFGRNIGTPLPSAQTKPAMQNLYFLWTVERVAMLYDLKTIGGKDWYGWGAQLLVANQRGDGHWDSTHYHGHNANLDTCFALLFLKRSNLVQDLTENLRLNMAIRDPDQK